MRRNRSTVTELSRKVFKQRKGKQMITGLFFCYLIVGDFLLRPESKQALNKMITE